MRFLPIILLIVSQNLLAMPLKFQDVSVSLAEPYELTVIAIDSSELGKEKKLLLNFVGVPEIGRAYVPRDLMQKVLWGIIAEQQRRFNGDDSLELQLDGVTVKGKSEYVLNHIFNPSITLKSPRLDGESDTGYVFTDKSQIIFRKIPKKLGDPIEIDLKLVMYSGEVHQINFQSIAE